VNSARAGGGKAEILHRMIPILKELGVDAKREVGQQDLKFLDVTRKIHNAIHNQYCSKRANHSFARSLKGLFFHCSKWI